MYADSAHGFQKCNFSSARNLPFSKKKKIQQNLDLLFSNKYAHFWLHLFAILIDTDFSLVMTG